MKSIGVIVNTDKDKDFKYTRVLLESINEKQGKVNISTNIAAALKVGTDSKAGVTVCNSDELVYNSSEIIICLGGDGTFLKAARKAYRKGIPVLGINLGTLGFLTEIDKDDIKNAIESIYQNKYCIEERMMLETTIYNNGETADTDIALNDIVISRGALSRILHLKSYIDDTFVDSFPGDGLIISTPTGSTAYSLSAGGPIVEPETELMIMTPICPHILYSRSLITTGSRTIKIVVEDNYRNIAMVTVDGQKGYEVRGGDCIEIRKAADTVKMIRINPKNFHNILRTKIYERGEKVKKNEV